MFSFSHFFTFSLSQFLNFSISLKHLYYSLSLFARNVSLLYLSIPNTVYFRYLFSSFCRFHSFFQNSCLSLWYLHFYLTYSLFIFLSIDFVRSRCEFPLFPFHSLFLSFFLPSFLCFLFIFFTFSLFQSSFLFLCSISHLILCHSFCSSWSWYNHHLKIFLSSYEPTDVPEI